MDPTKLINEVDPVCLLPVTMAGKTVNLPLSDAGAITIIGMYKTAARKAELRNSPFIVINGGGHHISATVKQARALVEFLEGALVEHLERR